MKSLIEKIKDLNTLADKDNCNGTCDLNEPYEKCEECSARSLLNEIGELVR